MNLSYLNLCVPAGYQEELWQRVNPFGSTMRIPLTVKFLVVLCSQRWNHFLDLTCSVILLLLVKSQIIALWLSTMLEMTKSEFSSLFGFCSMNKPVAILSCSECIHRGTILFFIYLIVLVFIIFYV